ncbi:MAG: hypothetical protein WCW67_02170 [Candidatus Margulisiibacteriota bacterium]|jgi:hypothetical protein
MVNFNLILTILIPFLLGYSVVALLYKEKVPFLERAALAWGFGIGLLGIEMYLLSILGVKLNLRSVLFPTVLLTGLLLAFVIAGKRTVFGLKSLPSFIKSLTAPAKVLDWRFYLEKTLVLMIGLTIVYVFFDALVKPTIEFDAMWRQGTIAKIILATGQVTEQARTVAGPHPYLNPLAQAWIYMGLGYWNDALGKIIFPLCFTSLLFIFYFRLRAQASRLNALIFTFLLTSFPLIILHAGNAYSDLMQTFYYSAGAIYLLSWFKDNKAAWLYSSALFFGIGNFVKQSGIPLWGASVIVLVLYLMFEKPKETKTALIGFALSLLISAPWFFSKNNFLYSMFTSLTARLAPAATPGTPLAAGTAAAAANPALGDLFYHLGRRMFTYADWQILWFIFIVATVLGGRLLWQSYLKYGCLLIVINLAMITYSFSNPGSYQYLVDGTLVNRLMMYQVPFVLFYSALIITAILAAPEPAVIAAKKSK